MTIYCYWVEMRILWAGIVQMAREKSILAVADMVVFLCQMMTSRMLHMKISLLQAGYKYTGVAKDNSNFGISLPVGTKVVLYCFRANGDVTYQAEYNQEPNYPDVLTDFNLMVTKTLQFHS
jgi:hypothetical protein